MTKLGRYAKAYPAARFSEFPGWAAAAAPSSVIADGAGADEEPFTYYFLQEDYTVTAGVYLDKNVAFDRVTDEWLNFCHEVLQFQPPLTAGAVTNSDGNGGQVAQIPAE
jgi:hypothetical protein